MYSEEMNDSGKKHTRWRNYRRIRERGRSSILASIKNKKRLRSTENITLFFQYYFCYFVG